MKLGIGMMALFTAAWLGGCAVDPAEPSDSSGAPASSDETNAEAARDLAIEKLRADYEEAQASSDPVPYLVNNELNGLRVKVPGDDRVYLIDRGVRRHIPDIYVFQRLFHDTNYIEGYYWAYLDMGSDIDVNAQLVNPIGGGPVYLLEWNTKRHITSPDTMNRYNFAWNHIVSYPQWVLDRIPTADPIW